MLAEDKENINTQRMGNMVHKFKRDQNALLFTRAEMTDKTSVRKRTLYSLDSIFQILAFFWFFSSHYLQFFSFQSM